MEIRPLSRVMRVVRHPLFVTVAVFMLTLTVVYILSLFRLQVIVGILLRAVFILLFGLCLYYERKSGRSKYNVILVMAIFATAISTIAIVAR